VTIDWDAPNALNHPAPPDGSWSTTNLAEALPGVASPLGWSIWARASDLAARAPFRAMGAIPESDFRYPARSEDRVINLFYGRIAVRVDFFCHMGDLVPGATGEAVARDAFGFVPPDYVSRPSKRRWPYFFVAMPATLVRTPKRVRTLLAENGQWYRAQIPHVAGLDLAGARALYRDAADRFEQAMLATSISIACVIQPAFTGLQKLAAAAGVDAAALMRSQGSHEEQALIANLWRVSRGEMMIEQFLAQHGYHGPDEGEMSNHSWREDPSPLEAIIAGYREMSDDQSPAARARAGAVERERAEAALFAALPAVRRPGAKLTLRMARSNIPLRAVGKTAYLFALDGARAAARRVGVLLAADGVLADPEDVFYLTGEELLGSGRGELRELVQTRRALREHYRTLELPVHWTGPPEPSASAPADEEPVGRIEAIGVSPGVVEGPVRVVEDPADTEMEPGDILVAHTTDPSWASVMFMAGALVVDIGGQMSHAAVVARELGVPCVMNTRVGTRALRTGDRVRVDGAAGTVDVL
jgi:pyruvate,water dikinase